MNKFILLLLTFDPRSGQVYKLEYLAPFDTRSGCETRLIKEVRLMNAPEGAVIAGRCFPLDLAPEKEDDHATQL